MNAIVNFENAQVPAFLRNNARAAEMNRTLADLATGFPTISIKGKVFSIVRDGERTILTRPDDPTAPLTSLAGVIVNASGIVKTYYENGFVEGSEDNKPTCFSNDGQHPDPTVDKPQCQNCRMCKWNVFGTSRSETGGVGKGKACSDSIRLAVMTGHEMDTYLLRVPPASLRALGQYTQQLMKKGIPFNAVMTKISFDISAATPKLMFDFMGFLNEAQYAKVEEAADSDIVMKIIGKDAGAAADVSAGVHAQPVAAPAPQPVMQPVAQPVQMVQPSPKTVMQQPIGTPQPVVQPVMQPVAQPVAQPVPQPAPAPVQPEAPLSDDDLNAMFDDAFAGQNPF